jgi:hypothetical protein
MPVHPALLSIATVGSLITAIKSSWELTRMLRGKYQIRVLARAQEVSREAYNAYLDNEISYRTLQRYDNRLQVAVERGDSEPGLIIHAFIR